MSLLNDKEFLRLEKDFKFLRRARDVYTGLTELERNTFVVLDLETTGLDPVLNEITEIGAFKLSKREIVETFHSLVLPDGEISAEIQKITGITPEMVKDQPKIGQLLPKFKEFAGDAIFVAHNSDFDLGFMKNAFQKHMSYNFKNPAICTVNVTRVLLPHLDNHKLHTVANFFGLPVTNRHRAMGDAEITANLWLKLLDVLKERQVTSLETLARFLVAQSPNKEVCPF